MMLEEYQVNFIMAVASSAQKRKCQLQKLLLQHGSSLLKLSRDKKAVHQWVVLKANLDSDTKKYIHSKEHIQLLSCVDNIRSRRTHWQIQEPLRQSVFHEGPGKLNLLVASLFFHETFHRGWETPCNCLPLPAPQFPCLQDWTSSLLLVLRACGAYLMFPETCDISGCKTASSIVNIITLGVHLEWS